MKRQTTSLAFAKLQTLYLFYLFKIQVFVDPEIDQTLNR